MNKILIVLATWLLALSGFVVSKVIAPVKVVETNTVIERQGAVASPDIQAKFLKVGGLALDPMFSQPFRNSSTTVCSYPIYGTSTVITALGNVNSATTVAATMFEWGWGATMDATTTSLGQFKLGSAMGSLYASTTPDPALTTEDMIDPVWTVKTGFLNLKYGNSNCADGKKCNSFGDVASSTCKAIIMRNL